MERNQTNKLDLFNLIFILLSFVLIISCSQDDTKEIEEIEETEIIITVEDLAINVNEYPENNYILGRVEAETNIGVLIFSIEEQSPSEALLIDSSTGELSVKDGSLFEFLTNPQITAIVKVTNADVFENSNITININEPQAPEYYRMIDENNVWIEKYSYGYVDGWLSKVYKLYIEGEEVINGKTYYNFYSRIIDEKDSSPYFVRENNSVLNENLLYKIREDAETKRVYALHNNDEVLLYDFSLEVSDTIDLWDSSARRYITQTVSEVETITLLNGESRKQIKFNSRYSITEGIGRSGGIGDLYLSGFFNENTLLYNPSSEIEQGFLDQGNVPVLSLENISLRNDTMLSKSILEGDGGNYVENNILEKGICWSSTSQNPTVNDNYTSTYKNEYPGNSEVSNLEEFYASFSISELQPNTIYYVRSYSKNANGIAYSETSYPIDSAFLTSKLTTSVIHSEYEQGYTVSTVLGKILHNNFPTNATIVEKGFANLGVERDRDNADSKEPFGVRFNPVEEGTLDGFETKVYREGFNYDVLSLWSYVKFDNGLIVYGDKLIFE